MAKPLWRRGWLLVILAAPLQAENLPDPTRPPEVARSEAPVAGVSASEPFQLTAILQGPERRVAIINGEAVREGQSLAGGKVLRIRPSSVQLLVDGEIQILEWPAVPVLRRSLGGTTEKNWNNR